jgi:hypothetical protein
VGRRGPAPQNREGFFSDLGAPMWYAPVFTIRPRMDKMKKKERIELVRRLAFEYAKSGQHHDWYTIECALRNEGLFEARSVLDNNEMRKELDSICAEAQKALAEKAKRSN